MTIDLATFNEVTGSMEGLAIRGVANPDAVSESGEGYNCFASNVGESALGYPGYRRPTSVSRESFDCCSWVGVEPLSNPSICIPTMSSTESRSAPPRWSVPPIRLEDPLSNDNIEDDWDT